MIYGYARVSSQEQNLDRQMIALKAHDVPESHIICEKASGKDFERPQWKRLVRRLKPGDVLVIKSLDRFGRNYDEILDTWRDLTKKDVGIVVLDMPILDTSKDRDLTGRLIADIVLQLLSYVAETERSFIRQRQREGIDAAKARGVRFGRPPRPRPPGLDDVIGRIRRKEITVRQAAQLVGIPRTTMYGYLPKEETS